MMLDRQETRQSRQEHTSPTHAHVLASVDLKRTGGVGLGWVFDGYRDVDSSQTVGQFLNLKGIGRGARPNPHHVNARF